MPQRQVRIRRTEVCRAPQTGAGRISSALCLLLSLACGAPALADREPVILLLSGGGARGAAHVGVLKVLEEEHVPVDAIVGTSMGALVGGLYAAGLSADEIEQTMLEAEWGDLFRDRPDRALESYRRKQDQREFLIHGRLRLSGLRPSLPLGAIRGRRVVELLREKTTAVAQVHDFSRLPIPFRAVATDLETGEAVVLDQGDLPLAMRASMAVPGAFTPVEIDGRHLIDGGISENLAIEVAQRAGPVRLIAVDISSPPLPFEELGSAAAVLNQAITLLMARENERQLSLLRPGDLLVQPDLGSFSSVAFSHADDAIRIGEEAARAVVDDLRSFSVSTEEYAAWRSRPRSLVESESGLLVTATVRAPDSADGRATRRRIEKLVGEPYDAEKLQRETERARATGLYERVDLVVKPAGDAGVSADLDLVPRVGGSDSLLFGLRLFDDFQGGTNFDLGVRWIGRHLTAGDLELRADLRLGERQAAILDLYRPIGESHRFFLESEGGFREEPFALYITESFFVRLRRRDLFARVDVGAALGSWGEIRVGVEQNWSRLRPSSDQGLDVGILRFDETLAHGRFGVDTLDDANFPGDGTLVRAEVDRILETDLDERGLTFGALVAQQAWSLGENRMLASVEVGDVLSGEPFFPRVAAGGLFRLSGFAENELRGSRLAIGTVRLARVLAGEAARNPIFVGGSLEYGTVLPYAYSLNWNHALWNGSVFLSIDSLAGPVYLYVGFAERGRRSWGFTLGRQIF